jgi:hypothetical protein
MKEGMKKPAGEDYRERSLAIHGLVCGRCGREFDHTNRHLLTVHHKDGNHHNNPPDGSNWENLCGYCHEDAHSRGVLGEYLEGTRGSKDDVVVYGDNDTNSGLGSLEAKFHEAMKKKKKITKVHCNTSGLLFVVLHLHHLHHLQIDQMLKN